jgi:hypothetical protein
VGHRYIRRFIEFSLPTMFAPGNIPALAEALPCTFVFLTGLQDAEFIAEHPGYQHLRSICRTEIELIDDLITGGNYSTTITLAYERAVWATGPATPDTCVLFLISDYLVADGSFCNVLRRMQGGSSGLLAGNFQVVEEDAAPEFHPTFAKAGLALTLRLRELIAWAMRHLHPMTAANMVNFLLNHSLHSNRLFWRVDEDTLIGRFYLMHMICIRPETREFVIGSSCDYSFVPEMCPSGNVGVLTDSDEYLVVEMQPRLHERGFLRIGPVAESLSEWTTARHRENAGHTLVFHAANLPVGLAATTAEADTFIAEVGSALSAKPKPHRDHLYWIGAIAAHRWAIERIRKSRQLTGTVDNDEYFTDEIGYSLAALIQKLRILVFGRAPDVHIWHPRLPDYRTIGGDLRALFAETDQPLAVIGHAPHLLRPWVSRFTRNARFLQTNRFLDLRRSQYTPLVGKFSGVLLFLDEGELSGIGHVLGRVLPLLAQDGFVLVVAINGRADRMQGGFGIDFALYSSQFLGPQCNVENARFVRASWTRVAVLGAVRRIDTLVQRYPIHAIPLALLVGLLMLAACVVNLLTRTTQAYQGEAPMISRVSLVLGPAREWARMPLPCTTRPAGGPSAPSAAHRASPGPAMRSDEALPHARARPASAPLRIGIDFDNTIIGDDAVFLAAARERKPVGVDMAGTKQAIRDAIRLLPDGEIAWQRLQGHVYGTGIRNSVLIDGVADFLRRCRAHRHAVYIVSHKTEFNRFDPARVNLRHAVLAWMEAQGLFGEAFGLARPHVFFEGTRADKLARIAALGCTHFIDDLEEVLIAPEFPRAVKRIMFSTRAGEGMPFPVCAS